MAVIFKRKKNLGQTPTNHEVIADLKPGEYYGENEACRDIWIIKRVDGTYIIKTLNSKGWWECVEFSNTGEYLCDFVEKD